jgi:23S rRNA (uracil1939-C5)-methyltransferase
MTLDETEQRDWKRRRVVEAIERVGKLNGVEVGETVPSDLDLGYRNKVELTFGREGDERLLGFHPSGSGDRVVDVERCLLQGEGGRRVLESIREFFLHGPGRSETALDARGDPPRVVIRESRATGKILVAVRTGPVPFPSAAPFARQLMSRHPEVGGVVRLIARPGRRGGSATETLAGDPWIEEVLAGTLFRLPAATFFQVNTGAAERLAQVVMGAAGAPSPNRVLDLYGGVGVFAIALAREGARATVVEADRGAVECGRAAVAAEGIAGVEFVASDVSAYLEERGTATGSRLLSLAPDLVVADPPRTGLGPGAADAIAALAPPRIILVSCDAPTLGRDLRRFVDRGYAIRRVVPVDLFPQTASVEAVAELHRVP